MTIMSGRSTVQDFYLQNWSLKLIDKMQKWDMTF